MSRRAAQQALHWAGGSLALPGMAAAPDASRLGSQWCQFCCCVNS